MGTFVTNELKRYLSGNVPKVGKTLNSLRAISKRDTDNIIKLPSINSDKDLTGLMQSLILWKSISGCYYI